MSSPNAARASVTGTDPDACSRPQMVVVVSHPRSGTHLTIDFLRRNFDSFDLPLPLSESAESLYVQGDEPDWKDRVARARARWPNRRLILQSHRAGVDSAHFAALRDEVERFDPVYLYPFRRMSLTLKSFAEYCAYRGDLRRWPGRTDGFFGTAKTVGECLEAHAGAGAERSLLLDIDALLADPAATCDWLGRVLLEEPRNLARRIPMKKVGPSRWAEVLERLRGRESTAVVVPRRQLELDQVMAELDEDFSHLHSALARRAAEQRSST